MVNNLSINFAEKSWNPTKPLPPELFRNVISFLESTQDLLSLCLTSQLCRAEAERILYHTIDLAEDSQAPTLWARTVLEDPRKALTVRSLTIRFDLSYLIVPSIVLPSLIAIAKAFREVQNLRVLRLLGHPTAMMPPLCSWLLDGCTFHLFTFENEVLPPSSIIPFISTQKQLRNWIQAGTFKQAPLGASLPSQLTDLEIHSSALHDLDTPTRLERLHLTMDHTGIRNAAHARDKERETIKLLGLFSPTLTSLIIEHKITATNASNHIQPSEVLSLLAEHTPNLTLLSYQTTLVYTCAFTAAFAPLIAPTPHGHPASSLTSPPPHLSHLSLNTPSPARSNLGSDNDEHQNHPQSHSAHLRSQYTKPLLQLTQLEVLILPLPPLPSASTGNQTRKHSRKSSVRNMADRILAASDSIQELSFVGDQREYTFVRNGRREDKGLALSGTAGSAEIYS